MFCAEHFEFLVHQVFDGLPKWLPVSICFCYWSIWENSSAICMVINWDRLKANTSLCRSSLLGLETRHHKYISSKDVTLLTLLHPHGSSSEKELHEMAQLSLLLAGWLLFSETFEMLGQFVFKFLNKQQRFQVGLHKIWVEWMTKQWDSGIPLDSSKRVVKPTIAVINNKQIFLLVLLWCCILKTWNAVKLLGTKDNYCRTCLHQNPIRL